MPLDSRSEERQPIRSETLVVSSRSLRLEQVRIGASHWLDEVVLPVRQVSGVVKSWGVGHKREVLIRSRHDEKTERLGYESLRKLVSNETARATDTRSHCHLCSQRVPCRVEANCIPTSSKHPYAFFPLTSRDRKGKKHSLNQNPSYG